MVKPHHVYVVIYPSGHREYFKPIRLEVVEIPDIANGIIYKHNMWLVYIWDPERRCWQDENSGMKAHRGIKHIENDCRELTRLERVLFLGVE